MSTTLHFTEIFGEHYDWIMAVKARHKALQGAKAAKKTKIIFMWSLVMFLCKPYWNIAVIREELKTHKDTTLEQIMWCLNHLDSLLNLNYSLLNEVKIVQSPSVMVRHKKHNTFIKTFGFDTNNANKMAGLEASTGYYMEWLMDEAVEEGKGAMEEEKVEEMYRMQTKAQNTMFRGMSRGDISETRLQRERVAFYAFNPWTPENQIKKYLIEPFITEDLQELFYKGQQWAYNPNYKGGYGIAVGIVNFQVNEFMPDNDRLMKWQDFHIDPKRALTEHLGMTQMVIGAIFTEDMEYVDVVEDTIEKYKHKVVNIGIGIDFASENDKTVFTVLGYTHNYEKEITFPQLVFKPSDKRKKQNSLQKAKAGLSYITEILNKLNWDPTHSIKIFIDDITRAFLDTVKGQYDIYRTECYDQGLEPYNLSFSFPKNANIKRSNAKSHIKNRDGKRRHDVEVPDEKILMSNGMQVIDAKNIELLRELNSLQWNEEKSNIKGADDCVQARWYARIKHRQKLFKGISKFALERQETGLNEEMFELMEEIENHIDRLRLKIAEKDDAYEY